MQIITLLKYLLNIVIPHFVLDLYYTKNRQIKTNNGYNNE